MTEVVKYVNAIHTQAINLPDVVKSNIIWGIANYLIEADVRGANPEDEYKKCQRVIALCEELWA